MSDTPHSEGNEWTAYSDRAAKLFLSPDCMLPEIIVMPDAPLPRTVIDEAAEIIHGARQASHGPPERSFGTIADMWNAYLAALAERAGTPFIPLAPYQVADLMELLKIARAVTGDPTHRDHYVDRIGYAALAHELAATNEQ